MVEPRGVEPLSEDNSTAVSTDEVFLIFDITRTLPRPRKFSIQFYIFSEIGNYNKRYMQEAKT
jgi:hypothetical protein